jgi:hypothetical protein
LRQLVAGWLFLRRERCFSNRSCIAQRSDLDETRADFGRHAGIERHVEPAAFGAADPAKAADAELASLTNVRVNAGRAIEALALCQLEHGWF